MVTLCTFFNPMLDILQLQYNLFFFWAPIVGLQVPNTRTLFGGVLGCTA